MKKLYILLFIFCYAAQPLYGNLDGEPYASSEREERLMYQAAPVLHEPSSISSDGFLLLWSPSSGATSYILDIAYNSSFTSYVSGYQNKSITGSGYGSQLAMVIAPLDGNTFYYCRLRAVGPGGTSSYSNVIEVPIDVVSSVVPTLFIHYANPSTLYLSWEQSSGSTYYELDVAYDASFSSFVSGYYRKAITGNFGTGNIPYSVTGLRGKTKYYCRVRGAGPNGVTAFSNVISATTPLGIPDVPTAVSAIDVTTESATLRWENAHMADSYRLDVSTSSSFSSFVNGYENRPVSGTSLFIDGLSANTTYHYRVRAVNQLGTSGSSNVVSFATLLPVPSTPVATSATDVTATAARVSWDAVSFATTYRLDVSTSSSFSSFVNGYENKAVSGTNFTVTGLPANSSCYYRVRAVNASGTSGSSNVVSFATLLPVPSAPVATSATDVTATGAKVSWASVPFAASYRLDVSTSSSFGSFVNGYENRSVSGTSLAIDGLSASTTYHYRVRAVNASGTSTNSNTYMFNTVAHIVPSAEHNYILTYTPVVEGLSSVEELASRDVDEVNWTVQYFDGLGRPSQNVSPKASPGRMDIVQQFYYDEFGRETRQYLPYRDDEPYYGSFKTDALGSQAAFYNTPPAGVAQVSPQNGLTYSFSETVYEASPLNRIVEQGAPGAAWQPESGHTVKTEIGTNDSSVRLWNLSNEGAASYVQDGQVMRGTYYDKGELYKTVSKDENWTMEDGKAGTVEEFKDKQGRVIMRRTFWKAVYMDGHITIGAETRYIYDDFGNLRYVLPPGFQGGSFTESSQGFNDYIFGYHYDHRNRMVKKKVPGADWIYMVYDQRDRLVLTQDGRQREAGEWTFTKYDALNRPVSTGTYVHPAASQEAMQAYVDGEAGNNGNAWFESDKGSSGNVHGYDNASFPKVADPDAYRTVTYYDGYGFKSLIAEGNYDYVAGELPGQEASWNTRVKGLVTGTKTRVLGTDGFLWGVTYYDGKYRPIQQVAGNHLGGTDRVTNIYNFPGWLMETRISHEGDETVTVHMEHTYDHAGRLLETWHTINNGDPVLLAANEYNELGELVKKHLHGEGNAHAQSVDYRYNIRGWLKRINNSDLSPDAGDHKDDLFGMELSYEDGFEVPQYNGNISGARWKNAVDNTERAYGYTYDAMNRLTGADYVAGGAGNWTQEENRFEVGNIRYDHNGNILALDRNGLFRHTMGEAPEYGITDQLTYHYRGNQLMAVNDAMDTPEGNASDFRDNGSKGTLENPEYTYDANGNMTWDGNKGITVDYNHLNLPKKVDFGNGKYIEYTYDATGTKLRQEVHDGEGPARRTDYVGGMVYRDGQLQFVQHGEGRTVMVDSDGLSKLPEYQYHLKDHLGNVRLTFSATPDIEVETATLETAHGEEESSTFLRYAETTKINSTLFDHTGNGDTHYAIRLNGSENERIGLARSLAVMTGDTIRAEVFAKYLDPDPSNWTAALQSLMAAIAGGTAPTGTVIEAVPPVGGDGFPFAGLLDAAKAGDTGTRAYLNILLFDENLGFLDAAFVPVTTAAMENGTNVPHEKLSGEIVVQQPGYAYIYFSNDNDQPLEVFFDDFTVEHSHSAIVQVDDYYPFGMTFNSYSRENSVMNRYLYNGKELQNELGLDWYDYGARFYDAALGRWHVVDPLAEQFPGWSPYNYAMNNPLRFVDPTGMAPEDFIVLSQSGEELRRIKMEGEDIYVKVNESAFNQASSRFDNNVEDYNTMLSVWSLRNEERRTGETGLISEQTGVGLSITGSMREGDNLIGDVSVSFQALFDDGSTHALGSYDGVAGGFGNGAPENGAYTVNNYQDRSPSGWYNKGMNRDGVGFSYNLNPQFSTGRSLLRIHPDGNNEGTLGCIGLSGNAQGLTDFRNTLNGYLNNGRTSLPVNINITNNPNNNGRSGRRIPNVNE